VNGAWDQPERAWHDTGVRHCEVCGCLIPRRAWVFERAGKPVLGCTPECEELYDSYCAPRYSPTEGGGVAR
jgi:hypothetical protein